MSQSQPLPQQGVNIIARSNINVQRPISLTEALSLPQTYEEDSTQVLPQPPFKLTFRLIAILSALYLSVFVAALDITIVSTAIPTITTHFQSASGYTWIGAAYLLANTATAPTWTNFSDIWGRKPIMLAAISTFVVASVICGRATSMGMLIGGRALQGAGAGGIVLLVNIVISDIFDMRRRSLYLALCEIVWALSGAIGPIAGGYFAEFVSWRWIWYINIPVGALAFGVLAFFLDVHNPRTPLLPGLKAIDWLGSLALLAVTCMTLIGLNFGGDTYRWSSPQVLSLIIIGLLTIGIFLLVEAKVARYPLMPLGLFGNVCNSATMILVFMHGMAMIAGEYYLPLYFQSVKGAGPLRSGLLALPFVFLEGVAGIVSGLIIHRTGRYIAPIWAGVLMITLGFGLFVDLKSSTSLAAIIIFQVITATGSGFLLQPPLTAVQANVSQRDTASATSTFEFIRQLSQSMSIVIGGAIFSNSMTAQQPRLESKGLPANVTHIFSGADAAANVDKLALIMNPEHRHLIQDAYAMSLRNMWIFYAAIAACSILAALLIRPHELSTEHTETRTGLMDRQEQSLELRRFEVVGQPGRTA